jgi:hypothetical protein
MREARFSEGAVLMIPKVCNKCAIEKHKTMIPYNNTGALKDCKCMRTLSVFFVLLNVITLVGPVLGVVLAYQDNLKGMVIPPQVENMVSGSMLTGGKFELPRFVSATPDVAGRMVTLVFEFTNPFNYDLMVKSISADVECCQHGFTLGQASLIEPTKIPAGATVELTIRCDWTKEAENHFNAEHSGATNIDANVVGLSINVNDITIESDEKYPVCVPKTGSTMLPQFVSATPDVSGQTVTIVLSYTNPFDYDLMIDSISADIECSLHGFTLGHASLVQPTNIAAGATSDVVIRCDWTQAAVDHFHAEHAGATSLAAKVMNVTIKVNGITVQSDQAYPIDVPIS